MRTSGLGRWVLILAVCSLSGCCPKAPPGGVGLGNWPAPISMDEQVRLLNARARQVPRLKAVTVTRGVELRYQDEHGQTHTDNAEGTLMLRQRFTGAVGSGEKGGADVFLVGRAFDREVFSAGKNDKEWWFLMRGEVKTAWLGSVGEEGGRRAAAWPGSYGRMERGDKSSVLRAELVPELLAITEIAPAIGETVAMRVNDDRGTNDVLLENFNPDRTAWIAREIVVDRRSGDVAEVNVRDRQGVLIVRAKLTDYQAAKVATPSDLAGPRLPRKVLIDYPAELMTVSLEFDGSKLTVPATMGDTPFETPDLEGMKVVREDG